MKYLAILRKSTLEQIRQFWILLLTVTMAAIFVGIFYMIYRSEKLHLSVQIVNNDSQTLPGAISYATLLEEYLTGIHDDTIPIKFSGSIDRTAAEALIRNKKKNALLILPSGFSDSVNARLHGAEVQVPFELSGDLTETNYMIAAIWAHSYVSMFINGATGTREPYRFTETPMGMSANMDDFSMAIPGLLVLATVMLMFSGAIAFVAEPENKTMLRLKLTKVSPFAFLAGVTTVQVVVGLLSILLTLLVAFLFNFTFSGSFLLFLLVCVLTSLSVIAFSLILAGATKSVNEVLVVGNFPLFLFMFFSGTMFPIHGKTLFTMGTYDFTIPGLMSTYHGVEALKKVTIFQSGFMDIWPELVSLTGLTVVYFLIGYWIYRKRHMEIF